MENSAASKDVWSKLKFNFICNFLKNILVNNSDASGATIGTWERFAYEIRRC